MASLKTLLLVMLSLLFLSSTLAIIDDDGEDLSFLEDPPTPTEDYPDYADPLSYENYRAWDQENPHTPPPPPPPPKVDEKDVVVLNNTTFGEVVKGTRHVMVEFYAPWCGYCKSLAPEYAAAATALKEGGSEVVLAKVDATQESELSDQYKIEGFPTIFLFENGVPMAYNGDRTKDAIVSWLKKKTGSALNSVTTTDEAEKILATEAKLVVAFVDSLTGPDTEELDAAAKLEEDINFYQTTSPEVAKIFQIDPNAKRPVVVLLKNEAEKLSQFEGTFSKSGILEFVSTNKLPLVINFTQDSISIVFENPAINKQVILFASVDESEKLIPSLLEAAKSFKGKLMFVYVDKDNLDFGKPLLEYFGIVADAPTVLGFSGSEGGRKFLLDGDVTLDNLKTFCEEFLSDMLKPFYKSDPVPDTNDGDVKIVVGENFEQIVLDESKDVLLEIYAPWCSHCQALEPAYNRLAAHLRGVDSIVVAKMDGTRNEHSRAMSEGFPTILFFPAGKKSSDPIKVDTERTAVELYKFLKKHATTPFKIEKPAEAPKSDLKDEL